MALSGERLGIRLSKAKKVDPQTSTVSIGEMSTISIAISKLIKSEQPFGVVFLIQYISEAVAIASTEFVLSIASCSVIKKENLASVTLLLSIIMVLKSIGSQEAVELGTAAKSGVTSISTFQQIKL